MHPRLLRFGAFSTLAIAGFLWVGVAVVQSPWVLLAGGLFFLIGVTGFVAVAARDIYDALAEADVGTEAPARPRV